MMPHLEVSSEGLEDFLSYLRFINAEYDKAYSAVGYQDKAKQDILHQIELGSYSDRNKYATKLAQVLRTRRINKDVVEITEDLHEFINKTEVKKIIHQLEEILGKMRKREQQIHTQSRIYKSRVIDDLPFVKERQERSKGTEKTDV